MYSRGHPSQSPRFSPNRRGSGGNNHHYNPYNNNNGSNCGYQQRQHYGYQSPSPRAARPNSSPSPQFQVPRSPLGAAFLGPAVPSPNWGPGCGQYPSGGYPQMSPGRNPYSTQRSPRQFSPRLNIFPSPSPRGRSNFSHGKTSTPNFRGRQGSWAKKNDCNPGGSSNIQHYYKSSMLEDPWMRLTPKPFTNAPASTT